MADGVRRVDVGFQGGQVLALRLPQEQYDSLRRALDGERGWHEVTAQDSSVALDLAQVVYLRLDTEEHRVGF